MTDRQERIKELREELELLEKAEREDRRTDTEKLADFIHDKTCHLNHTDGCGYTYSSWKDPCDTRKRYRDKALTLLGLVGHRLDVAMGIVRVMAT